MALAAVNSSGASLDKPAWTTNATPTPVASSKRAASFATTAANLAVDAGVIASFSGGSAALDSTTRLYDSLVNAGQNSATSTTSAVSAALGLGSTTAPSDPSATDGSTPTDTTTASPDGSTTPSTTPGSGAAWASILKANPLMAPLAAQLTQRQQIVDLLA